MQGNHASHEYMLATEKVAFATASDVLADDDRSLPYTLEKQLSLYHDTRSPSFSTSGDSVGEDFEGKETNRASLPELSTFKSVEQRARTQGRSPALLPNFDRREVQYNQRADQSQLKWQCTLPVSTQVKDIRTTRQLNKILSTLYKSGRAAEALKLCGLVEEEGRIMMDVASYSILISCLGKCGAPGKAIEMFYKMVREGVSPNAFTFSAIFGALSDSSYLEQALVLLRMIRARYPMELNVVVYNAVLKFVGRAGSIDAALELLGQMERDHNVQPDIVTYGTILDICAKKQDVPLAYAVLDRMRKRGMRPNNFCYASLIDACARAGLPDQAESLFRQLRDEGLEYDIFVCNALLGAFARARMVERAFSAFEEMRLAGLRGDRITFNTLITAAARAREFNKAWKAFEAMKNANISADTTTYNALIDACSKSGMTEIAFALFEEMRGARLRPTIFTFNALIGACTKLQDMRRASHVLSLMEDFGVQPDTFTLNILLSACVRNEDLDYALHLVREFESRYHISLDRLGLSILTNLCLKISDSQSRTRCANALRAAIDEGQDRLREILDRVMGSATNEF
jgi:pentatricopeptide repeat protein